VSRRRELAGAAVVALALLAGIPAVAAGAAWLDGEPRDTAAASAAPDVTAYGDVGVALWLGADRGVYAAERPRGGPWGGRQTVAPASGAFVAPPKVVALPSGELVAAWAQDAGFSFPFPGEIRAARRPPGGGWSSPQTLSTNCCPDVRELAVAADGTVIALWTSRDGSPQTAVKPPGSATFDAPQNLPGQESEVGLAVAADGSALAVQPCFTTVACVEALFRLAGGTWGSPEFVTETPRNLNAIAVTARPGGAGFTVAWSEDANVVRSQNPRGELFSRDRAAGPGGTWAAARAVAASDVDASGCPSSFGCLDLATAPDGAQAAVWQQGPANPAISASLRSGGGAWGAVERVGPADGGDAFPQAAFTAAGTPVAAWVGDGGTAVRRAHRTGPGSWVVRELSRAARGITVATAHLQDVVPDAEGNALTGWSEGASVLTGGFDGAGPRFTAFSVPAAGPAGAALPFSAAADDNWSGVASLGWRFDDGADASGGSVSHAYATAGPHAATASATDGAGNTSERSGATVVSPVVGGCGTRDRDADGIRDGCDQSDGSQLPVPFKTVNATVVSGEVFVKPPAGAARAAQAAPKGFRRLQGSETIAVGSTLDTAKGVVRLRSAADTRRHVQRARFSRGRFVVRQQRRPRRGSRRASRRLLLTDLRLAGSSFGRTCRTATASASARRSKRRVRRLFGDGKGSFRTSGRTAAATVRGTRWGVLDRCDGTLVNVRRGVVEVRDFARRRTVILRTGHTYLARRR